MGVALPLSPGWPLRQGTKKSTQSIPSQKGEARTTLKPTLAGPVRTYLVGPKAAFRPFFWNEGHWAESRALCHRQLPWGGPLDSTGIGGAAFARSRSATEGGGGWRGRAGVLDCEREDGTSRLALKALDTGKSCLKLTEGPGEGGSTCMKRASAWQTAGVVELVT